MEKKKKLSVLFRKWKKLYLRVRARTLSLPLTDVSGRVPAAKSPFISIPLAIAGVRAADRAQEKLEEACQEALLSTSYTLAWPFVCACVRVRVFDNGHKILCERVCASFLMNVFTNLSPWHVFPLCACIIKRKARAVLEFESIKLTQRQVEYLRSLGGGGRKLFRLENPKFRACK